MEDGDGHIRSSALAILIAVAALASGIAGCGGSGDSSTTPPGSTGSDPTTATSSSGHDKKTAADTSACKNVKPSKAKSATYSAPEQVVKQGERLTAVVKTSCGVFHISLNAKRFPTTVNSFVFLAEKGFYDGLGFEQAAFDTYVEGGKPNGGAGGPGYSVVGRIPSGFIYRHRVVAMSQSGEATPGHAGSQFFIVVTKPWLDFGGVYAPLGTVDKADVGVLESISELGPPDKYPGTGNIGTAGEIGKLRKPVLIESVTIERA
jgi:peptidyl-prolyl cis-trans isomerase B (cyclophilin B)